MAEKLETTQIAADQKKNERKSGKPAKTSEMDTAAAAETTQVADQKKNERNSGKPAETSEIDDSSTVDDTKNMDEAYGWEKDDVVDDGKHARKVRKWANNIIDNILK